MASGELLKGEQWNRIILERLHCKSRGGWVSGGRAGAQETIQEAVTAVLEQIKVL